jgi:hypothetical protein
MDVKNRFHTAETFLWVRVEHVILMMAAIILGLLHVRELDWARFIVAFVAIDLIGYIPGAIAARRSGGGPISPVYHALYNLTHSYVIAGAAVGAWALLLGGGEWAMLAVPIHLSGDRGLFGNTFKPVSLPFEPHLSEIGSRPAAVDQV